METTKKSLTFEERMKFFEKKSEEYQSKTRIKWKYTNPDKGSIFSLQKAFVMDWQPYKD